MSVANYLNKQTNTIDYDRDGIIQIDELKTKKIKQLQNDGTYKEFDLNSLSNSSINPNDVIKNTNDIATNNINIATNSNNINTNTNDIKTNTNNINTNTNDIKTNTNNISTNSNNISTNSNNISTNSNDISTNTNNINTNTNNISTNTNNIATNTNNITTNSNNLNSIIVNSGGNVNLKSNNSLVIGANSNSPDLFLNSSGDVSATTTDLKLNSFAGNVLIQNRNVLNEITNNKNDVVSSLTDSSKNIYYDSANQSLYFSSKNFTFNRNTSALNRMILDPQDNDEIVDFKILGDLSVSKDIKADGLIKSKLGYSFQYPGDETGGIFSIQSGTLDFHTAGSLKMRITSTGNVGIGQYSSLNHRLTVNGPTLLQDVLTVGRLAGPPSNPQKGMIYYDTILDQFRLYEKSSWRQL